MSDKSASHQERIRAAGLERVKELMKQHEAEAQIELDEQWEQQFPAHVIYFVAVIVGAFVLNLLVLVLIAGT